MDPVDGLPRLGMYRKLGAEFFRRGFAGFFVRLFAGSARAAFPWQQAPLRAYFDLPVSGLFAGRTRWVLLTLPFPPPPTDRPEVVCWRGERVLGLGERGEAEQVPQGERGIESEPRRKGRNFSPDS